MQRLLARLRKAAARLLRTAPFDRSRRIGPIDFQRLCPGLVSVYRKGHSAPDRRPDAPLICTTRQA
ncbi:hypothetical protein CNR27_07715 [Luteimonas chenhongjianii]|uniref:Uncharacterized protein n=1 Tax=Luteimonas chenhongjianii TaxID=2006110 RepID=A0A290XEH0_9GAMM|nr:hypothetical protein CNR27_07715 [Luteimonas chenhongjianii]RPD86571.1 hypothetical protein EGK76_07980 [Luteimonas sp. 100069]